MAVNNRRVKSAHVQRVERGARGALSQSDDDRRKQRPTLLEILAYLSVFNWRGSISSGLMLVVTLCKECSKTPRGSRDTHKTAQEPCTNQPQNQLHPPTTYRYLRTENRRTPGRYRRRSGRGGRESPNGPNRPANPSFGRMEEGAGWSGNPVIPVPVRMHAQSCGSSAASRR